MTVKQTPRKPRRVGDGTPGPGRPKGVPNRATVAVKAAMQAVYADLQAEAQAENGHFREWAKANPTEFYKLWAKMLPTEISGPGGQPIQTEDMTQALAGLSKPQREAMKAAIRAAMLGDKA